MIWAFLTFPFLTFEREVTFRPWPTWSWSWYLWPFPFLIFARTTIFYLRSPFQISPLLLFNPDDSTAKPYRSWPFVSWTLNFFFRFLTSLVLTILLTSPLRTFLSWPLKSLFISCLTAPGTTFDPALPLVSAPVCTFRFLSPLRYGPVCSIPLKSWLPLSDLTPPGCLVLTSLLLTFLVTTCQLLTVFFLSSPLQACLFLTSQILTLLFLSSSWPLCSCPF